MLRRFFTFLFAAWFSVGASAQQLAQVEPSTNQSFLAWSFWASGNVPAVALDFTTLTAQSTSFLANLSFSRPSLAMMTDATGNLTYAPNNLLTQSNNFADAAWSATNMAVPTLSSVVSPNGNLFLLTNVLDRSFARLQQSVGPNNSINNIRVAYMAAGDLVSNYYGFFSWGGSGGGAANYVIFNLSAGTYVKSAGVIAAGLTPLGAGYPGVFMVWAVGPDASSNAAFQIGPSDGTSVYNPPSNLGQFIYARSATSSAVTYETTPRPQDQVITTSAAYYGPRLQPTGLLIEEARTNIFQNTSTPATHSVAVTAQPYTLSFYGTGSVTISGVATGTLNGPGAWPQTAPAKLTFTPTAGTLTLTVSGTIQYPNLEAGSFPTSHIPNGATTTTRAADVVQIVGPALTVLQGAQGSVVAEYGPSQSAGAGSSPVVVGNSAAQLLVIANPQTTVNSWNGSVQIVSTISLLPSSNLVRAGVSWSGVGRSIVGTGGILQSDLNAIGSRTPEFVGSIDGTARLLNGPVARLAIYNTRLPNAVLKAKTVLGTPL